MFMLFWIVQINGDTFHVIPPRDIRRHWTGLKPPTPSECDLDIFYILFTKIIFQWFLAYNIVHF